MLKRNLELNQAKLDEFDAQILETRNELDEAHSPGEREDIERRLKDLEIERRSRLEVINRDTDRLRSQINRIKETIDAMLDSDYTLREKIRILFREQGITIASVLAAISLAISTLVSSIVAAVRGASASVPAVTPEPPAPIPEPPEHTAASKSG